MTSQTPPFNAQERDIDLMLLEELHCDPAFVTWIAGRVGIAEATLACAKHSVYRDNGETDVFVLIDTSEGRIAIMIEDKIGAKMQPRQAERYHERGEQLCTEGSAMRFYTLLCAPLNYLKYIESVSPGKWHTTLPFEELSDWFSKKTEHRAKWRCDILIQAIKRQQRSMANVTDENLRKFKEDYRRYVSGTCPEFKLTPQSGRDIGYYFTETNFPTYMRLVHSFNTSTMILAFENHWKDKALEILQGKIPGGMEIDLHPTTAHLVTGVEPIDLTESVESQTDLIDAAMDAARRLLPYATMVQQG